MGITSDIIAIIKVRNPKLNKNRGNFDCCRKAEDISYEQTILPTRISPTINHRRTEAEASRFFVFISGRNLGENTYFLAYINSFLEERSI